jgi:DNA-3-methyladenine glycosylase I
MPCMSVYTGNDPLYRKYHDEEWSRPEHEESKLYGLFVLELFQAGLSWRTLLHKRENFRQAFDDFDVQKIASYGETKINELMENPGIIRNRKKIEAAVVNARVVMEIQKEFGSFSAYLWHFTKGKSIVHPLRITHDALSDDVSRDMKERGMKFCGSVTIYSFLQAAGIIYSHTKDCPCWKRDGADAFVKNHYRRRRTKKVRK